MLIELRHSMVRDRDAFTCRTVWRELNMMRSKGKKPQNRWACASKELGLLVSILCDDSLVTCQPVCSQPFFCVLAWDGTVMPPS